MATKTVCMLSCLHNLYDDRIYWKEALSLKSLGYNVVHIGIGDTETVTISEHGIKLISTKLINLSGHSLSRALVSLLFPRLKYRFIYKQALAQKADIYNIHDLPLNILIRPIKRKMPYSKIIYSMHESYPDMIRDYRQTNGIKTILKKIYAVYVKIWEIKKSKLADHLVTFDDAMYDTFSKILGKHKTSLIYNFSNFDVAESTNTAKEFDLIYLGGMTKPRGILKILEAVGLLIKKIPDIKLLLLGTIHEEWFKDEVKQSITDHKIKNNVTLINSIPHEQVAEYLKKSKIGLVTLLPIPKYLKNIPIKQFEYMAAGLPVVGSNIPPIEKFIKEADAGIIVDPENPSSIATAIERLLLDNMLYEKYSRNGYFAATDLYNWKNEELKLKKLYSKLTQ